MTAEERLESLTTIKGYFFTALDEIYSWFNDWDTKISALEGRCTALESALTTAQADITACQTDLDAAEVTIADHESRLDVLEAP